MISILKHISFARDWLDKAEEKIKYGKLPDGELYLSLAEAEVRKAWENSLIERQEISKSKKKKPLSYLIASAVVILLVFFSLSYLNSPAKTPETIELQLTDGFRERTDLQRQESEIRLINVDLMINNNFDRRNMN